MQFEKEIVEDECGCTIYDLGIVRRIDEPSPEYGGV